MNEDMSALKENQI